jgi:circadian clock protein KaiB
MKPNKNRHAKRAPARGLAAPPVRRYVLRLFVAGATDRSRQAVLVVHRLCEAELTGECDLEVIDIYQQPELARRHQIVATPTLVREAPRPARRFIGNLSNIAAVFVVSGLTVRERRRP